VRGSVTWRGDAGRGGRSWPLDERSRPEVGFWFTAAAFRSLGAWLVWPRSSFRNLRPRALFVSSYLARRFFLTGQNLARLEYVEISQIA
jgi:hypothetical protein